MKERGEKDALGELAVPESAYWGIHTQRALANFQVSGAKVPFRLIQALAMVKKAACLANLELGYLEEAKARAVLQAAEEIIAGGLQNEFPLNALQGGAGTSTNMNVNEVLANRALEIMGRPKGDYSFIHPIETANRHQSTNDVYPTAIKVAAIFLLRELSVEIALLQGVFQKKEKEFGSIIKIGRTEYQEAVPITLGAEFSAFAEALSRDRWRVFKCEERLRVTNLGGTAVGTGLTAPKSYIFLVIEKLREVTGLGLSRAENLAGETAFADSFVEVSGILKAHACNLIKIANDLRLLNLLGEIKLPAVQAGSSIMPGKVNPVILEAVIQAAVEAKASDAVIAECVSRGTLQINEFLPLAGYHLLSTLEHLAEINRMFVKHAGQILACEAGCRFYLEKSPVLLTAFLPHVGYENAGALFQEFKRSGSENVRDFLNKKFGNDLVDKVLSPENLTQLGYRDGTKNA